MCLCVLQPRGEIAKWCLKHGKLCKSPYTTPTETHKIAEIFAALDTNKSGKKPMKCRSTFRPGDVSDSPQWPLMECIPSLHLDILHHRYADNNFQHVHYRLSFAYVADEPMALALDPIHGSDIARLLDVTPCGVGFLDMLELFDAMKAVSGRAIISKSLISSYLKQMDANGDGLLSLHEFTSYLASKYLLKPGEEAHPLMVEMVCCKTRLNDSISYGAPHHVSDSNTAGVANVLGPFAG